MADGKIPDGSQITQQLFVDHDSLRQAVRLLVEEVLHQEVLEHLGAGSYERTDQRRGQRNGYKRRTMNSCVGKLEFSVPQVREGGFQTKVFERHQRSERALIVAIQEMYVKGVSTRKVGDILEKLGCSNLSAATVCRAAAELDDEVLRWRTRSLGEKQYPFLLVDARYERVRNLQGRVVSQAVLVIAGVTHEGKREVLGLWIGDSESESTWGAAFSELKQRGLSGVELVVSDAHKGIRAAVAHHFQGCLWQRCKVHWMREAIKKGSWREEKQIVKDLQTIFAAVQREQCLAIAEEVAAKWEKTNPKLAKWIGETVEDCLAVWHLPSHQRRRLNSTNMLERLMRELKRRSRVVSIFPNEQSLIRLLGSVLIEMNEQWGGEEQVYINV